MKTVPTPVRDELCRRFNGNPASLSFLGGGEDWSDGVLFQFDAGDAAPGRLKVLKVLEFMPEDAGGLKRAEDRLRLVQTFGEKGARIVLPEPSRDGAIFEVLEEGARVFMGYAYMKAPGRSVDRKDAIAHKGTFYRAMGSVLGRMHVISEERAEILSPDGTSSIGGEVKGWRNEWEFFRTLCRDDEVGAAFERFKEELSRLPVDKAGYGFVHNDAHVWNMLLDPEAAAARPAEEPELTVIDFDCAGYHWYMMDSAIALDSTLSLAAGGLETQRGAPAGFREKAFSAFWDGYRRFRDPGREWLDRLDLFLQYHKCLLFMPFQEQTAKHPAWRKRWKQSILEGNKRLFGA